MIKFCKKLTDLINNYVIARILNRPSTANFWYLPEPAIIHSQGEFKNYLLTKTVPKYLIDYAAKLEFSLTNQDNIIVLPYDKPIGNQINPEAAFQFALGLHDKYCNTADTAFYEQFMHYANYFCNRQTLDGLWQYNFDWFTSKAPWSSALAQSRGASVMLRAWLHTKDVRFKNAATLALTKFSVPIEKGGFQHNFTAENCVYFEEYPETPTGVINGFMAALICIWELNYWLKEAWLENLWQTGIASLEKMLPHYSTGWWSLYDIDEKSPLPNVNSPRYHLLELTYIKILSILSASKFLTLIYDQRLKQYHNPWYRLKALTMKTVRKVLYK